MIAAVLLVEVAHPVTDRRRGSDDIGDRFTHAVFGEPVDRTRNTKHRNDPAGVVMHRRGDGVEPFLEFLDGRRMSVPSDRRDLCLEFPQGTLTGLPTTRNRPTGRTQPRLAAWPRPPASTTPARSL